MAEITWRWTFGAVAGSLFIFGLIEFLSTLPVTNGDAALLKTRQPVLLGRAIAHIFRGSFNRAVFAALLALLFLSLFWIIVASIGRFATVCALLEYFRAGTEADAASASPCQTRVFRRMVPLHLLRVAVALAALLGILGAAVLVSFVSSDANPRPGLVILMFLPMAGLIGATWSTLNWLLGFASVFVVRDGVDALGSVAAAVGFLGGRLGPVCAVSTWTGLAHLVAFSLASSAIAVPLAFARFAPTRLVIVVIVLITLAYFAIVDWLYVVRLAGYVYIAEMPKISASLPSVHDAPRAGVQNQDTIDRDELILGDIPNLALER